MLQIGCHLSPRVFFYIWGRKHYPFMQLHSNFLREIRAAVK